MTIRSDMLRKFSSVTVAVIFILSAVLSLMVPFLSDTPGKAFSDEQTEGSSMPMMTLALTPHNPILINGNAGFTNSSGVVWGSGTESDPYIIEGLSISSTTVSYAFDVTGTTAFFVVRGCSLKGAMGSISLENVRNGNVTGNELLGEYSGIIMQQVGGSVVSNNSCTVSGGAITLFESNDNLLVNNMISSASYDGIELASSVNVTLHNNSLLDCGLSISAWQLNHANTHTIDDTNTVRGKPVYYYKNLDGATIPGDAGEVILGACSNMTVQNMSFSDGTVGVLLMYSSEVLVENVLSWNMSWCGIMLDYCTNVSIRNSSFNYNGNGIFIDFSVNTLVSGCTASWNHVGIIVQFCTNTELRDNDCAWNDYGFFVVYSEYLTLAGNVLFHNDLTMLGYDLSEWNTHSIDDTNTVNGLPIIYIKDQIGGDIPNQTGLFILANCTDLVISGHNFDTGGQTAVLMAFATNVTFEECVFSHNDIGVYMQRSNYNQFVRNDFTYSGLCIYAQYCERNLFFQNNFTNSATGIDLDVFSNWNEITFNTFQQNSEYAIKAERTSIGNGIYYNLFIHNHGSGSTYSPTKVQAYDDCGGNYWNVSGYGNYWYDWTTPDVNPADGIVDLPYSIDGGADVKDYCPLTTAPPEPIPEFGVMPLVVIAFLGALLVTIGARRRKAQ